MRYFRTLLLCGVAAVTYVISPESAQTPQYARASEGKVQPQPETREGFTRIRFSGSVRYFPEVSRDTGVIRIALDGGGRFDSIDVGADDPRVRAIRAVRGGKILEILLNNPDVGSRIYFSESASGVDIIDCPCPTGTENTLASIQPVIPDIPDSDEDSSVVSLHNGAQDTSHHGISNNIPAQEPDAGAAAATDEDASPQGVYIYEQTSSVEEDLPTASIAAQVSDRMISGATANIDIAGRISDTIARIYNNTLSQTTTVSHVRGSADTTDTYDEHDGVSFHWSRKPSMAFFRRGDRYWLVAAAPSPINAEDLRETTDKVFASFSQINHPTYQIYYGKKRDDIQHLSLKHDDTDAFYAVSVVPAAETPHPKTPIRIVTDVNKLTGSSIRITDMPLISPLRLYDPVIGDELLIMTAYNEKRGLKESRIYPDFNFLPSLQGVVAELRSDRVVYEFNGNDIVMVGPTHRLAASTQSILSELREQERLKNLAQQANNENSELSLIKFKTWKAGPDRDFLKNKYQLLEAINNAIPGMRSEPRLNLARFYLAHGLEAEAAGIIGVLREKDPGFAARPHIILEEGVAYYLAGQYKRAIDVFAKIDVSVFSDNMERMEADMWKKMADVQYHDANILPEAYLRHKYMSDTHRSKGRALLQHDDEMKISSLVDKNTTPPPVPELSEAVDSFMAYYPTEIYNNIVTSALNAHLLRGDVIESDTVATMVKGEDTRPSFINYVNVARGIMRARDGDSLDALMYWQNVSEDINDPKNRALALFLTAYVSYQEEYSTPKETIDRLNRVRTSWRGGVIELNALKTVGQLYIDQHDYMRGFEAWRVAAKNLTQFPVALDLSAKLNRMFVKLLGRKENPKLSQLDMLTLFYEFRELVPVGDAGDKIITTLADRLISVDLLSRASALLTHQVQYRLQGEQKDEAIFKLVDIHMRNNRYDSALAVLENIEASSEHIRDRVKYLSAYTLIEMKRYNKALKLLRGDESSKAAYLRTEIYWRNRVWRHVVTELAPIFREIRREQSHVNNHESEQIVRLAVAYALLEQRTYLKILREDFADIMQDTKQKDLFMFITLDRGNVDPDRLDHSLEFAEINRFMKQYESIAPQKTN